MNLDKNKKKIKRDYYFHLSCFLPKTLVTTYLGYWLGPFSCQFVLWCSFSLQSGVHSFLFDHLIHDYMVKVELRSVEHRLDRSKGHINGYTRSLPMGHVVSDIFTTILPFSISTLLPIFLCYRNPRSLFYFFEPTKEGIFYIQCIYFSFII